MTINQYFDKVFFINSKKRIDRLANMRNRLSALGIEAHRFEALLGGHLNSKEFNFGNSLKKLNNAEIGCFQSHRSIYKIIKEEKLSKVLILEDDALFCNDFNKMFSENIQHIPDDWNMLYFGQFNYDYHEGKNGSKTLALKENIKGNVYKADRCWLTHAYAIKDCSSFLYENTGVMYNTFDGVLADVQKNLNVYAFHPNIIKQDNTESSIRPFLKKKQWERE